MEHSWGSPDLLGSVVAAKPRHVVGVRAGMGTLHVADPIAVGGGPPDRIELGVLVRSALRNRLVVHVAPRYLW
ncbi:MAG TPA: hypothetical protein VGL18_00930 [Actinomycetota bacterium]